MSDLKVINHRDTIDHFPGGLVLTPGFNRVPKELVREATEKTRGSPDGFEARFKAGLYEVQKIQVSIKRQGGRVDPSGEL